MSIFELLMLLCFGAAWPFSIHKSLTSHSIKGKSLTFLVIVWVGYLAGVLHKFLYHLDIVLVFYIINLAMVSIDTVLFLRNRRIVNANNSSLKKRSFWPRKRYFDKTQNH